MQASSMDFLRRVRRVTRNMGTARPGQSVALADSIRRSYLALARRRAMLEGVNSLQQSLHYQLAVALINEAGCE